ncbi:MAG: hypothetical protein IIZ78_16200 [Clostridiales bacterium]|nr:hypothetical protein [Clostridiales bacterium]
MVIAGRVLIIPKGAWSNLTPYEMLDLVSEGDKAYLARQASVGMRPSEDASMTYWQPFGSSASIATTDTPGLVMPDGVTITVDATGLIVANLNVSDLKDIKLTNLANGDILKYDGTQSKWVNVALGTAATRNATSSITSGSTDLIESGAVNALKQTLEQSITGKLGTSDIANNLTTTTAGKVLDATQGLALANKHKVTRKTVNTSSWTADSTSQSGSTLYKKSIALSHVYVDSPSVDIATSTGSGLPTTAQQEAFDLLQYVTVDGTTMYLYASDIPSTTFYIEIEGVD